MADAEWADAVWPDAVWLVVNWLIQSFVRCLAADRQALAAMLRNHASWMEQRNIVERARAEQQVWCGTASL